MYSNIKSFHWQMTVQYTFFTHFSIQKIINYCKSQSYLFTFLNWKYGIKNKTDAVRFGKPISLESGQRLLKPQGFCNKPIW